MTDVMIITHLMGGMGNQMFQYAAGKELAIRFNVPLKLDISGFKWDPLRHYALDCYNIEAQIAEDDEIGMYKFSKIYSLCRAIPFLRNIINYPRNDNNIWFREHCFQYNENIQRCSENTYLEGYWQSERYFKKIEDIIRKDFTLKKELPPDLLDLARFLGENNSVGIHVRRSDYISNPSTNATHGTCSPEYYNKAINMMTERLGDSGFTSYWL